MEEYRYNRSNSARNTYSYVHGTAVPKENTPYRRQRQTAPVRRRYVQAQKINPIVLVSWIIASVVFIAACGLLLMSQNRMNAYVDEVSALETQIAELKAENNLTLARINESVDYDAIQQEAESLGMVKLTSDKIIDIEYSGSEYIRQYKSVP